MYPYIHLSIYRSSVLSINQSSIYPSILSIISILSILSYAVLSIHPSILSILYPSIHLSIYPSIQLSIYLSMYLCIYLSIYLSIYCHCIHCILAILTVPTCFASFTAGFRVPWCPAFQPRHARWPAHLVPRARWPYCSVQKPVTSWALQLRKTRWTEAANDLAETWFNKDLTQSLVYDLTVLSVSFFLRVAIMKQSVCKTCFELNQVTQ